jgi:capsular exopolysaccharide synthesis family protein
MTQPQAAPTADEDLDLGRLFQALDRRRRLAFLVFVVSVLSGALFTSWQRAFRPTYQGSFQLLVSDPINTDELSGRGGGSLEAYALVGSGSTNTATLLQVLTSPLLLGPVETRLGLGPNTLGSVLSVGLPASRGNRAGDAGVLEVSMQWRNPQQGKEILQEVSRTFLNYSLRQRQEKLNQGLAFLEQQAPNLEERVNTLQSQLAAFRRAKGFVEPEQEAGVILGQRQSLVAQIVALQQDQARLEGRLAAVRRGDLGTSQGSSAPLQPPASASPASEFDSIAAPSSSRFGSTGPEPLNDLNQLELTLAEAEANFTDSSPQVRELRAKIAQLRPVLQARQVSQLQADLSQNLSQQREIRRQLTRLADSFQANPNQIKQYQALQQQLEVARDNLSSYIKARENFRLQVAQRTVPWSVLTPPQFGGQPVKPSMGRNLMMSVLFGLMGGVGVALLRDRLDPVFHDPLELKDALPLPLLGVVPYLVNVKGITVAQALEAMDGGERFETRESLRNLFANFRLLRADKTVRLVALTSATPGEGKSTSTALFALTLAQLGERVLLVDADMRRPMLHFYVGAENGDGLSSLLTDTSVDLARSVIPVVPGLDLLPAGPMPPDTTRLLSSERCAEVVAAIRNLPDYDLVLFDTPPAFLLSDPILLAEHLDGLLLVVGIERVNRDLPLQALERMQGTGVDVLGVLANLPNRRRKRQKSLYGYRSANGYGYGYAQGRYGGYQELANRYDSGDNGRDNSSESPTTPHEDRQTPSVMVRGAHRVARWLDRRD